MTEYRCPDCGHWLCSTDATRGRILVLCRNRRCPDRRAKTIRLSARPPVREDCAILVASG